MAKLKQEKAQIIADLKKGLSASKAAVFFGFSGLKIKEMNGLRQRCKQAGIHLEVFKKTLLRLALKGFNSPEIPLDEMKGNLGLICSEKEIALPGKIVYQFKKEHENLQIFSGILEGRFADEKQIVQLAQLPSQEELLRQLLAGLQAPLQKFIFALRWNLMQLVFVLKNINK